MIYIDSNFQIKENKDYFGSLMKVNYQNELFKIRKIEIIGKDFNHYIFEQICQELNNSDVSTTQC